MNIRDTYNMSFTTGGLCLNESIRVAEVYSELGDWAQTREKVLKDNILQARKSNSAKRIYQDVEARLRILTEKQFKLFLGGSRFEQSCLLWIAICKRHKFIREFAGEVIREKYLHLELALTYSDFDAFFSDKSEWHEELESLSDSTKAKVRQVLFRTMNQAGLISKERMINPILLTKTLVQVISADDKSLFMVFPTSELDIKTVINGDNCD